MRGRRYVGTEICGDSSLRLYTESPETVPYSGNRPRLRKPSPMGRHFEEYKHCVLKKAELILGWY